MALKLMPTPVIKTSRLTLTPFAERHLTQRYVDWLNDKSLMRFSEQRYRDHTLETCRAYWRSLQGTPNGFWAIEVSGEKRLHVGNVGATIDICNETADVAILVGAVEGRGRGYGLEAFQNVVDALFAHYGVRKVTAGTMAANTAMRRIMQAAGMAEDGVRSRQLLLDGREVDVVHSALFREQWERDGGLS